MVGALIITAEIAPHDHAWLDQLRRAHYPAERNRLPAHLTMFHALPPSADRDVRIALARLALARPPNAMIAGLMNLGGGVAFRVVSDELDRVRHELVRNFHGLLSAQDAGGWRPHVTIQNKVTSRVARALLAHLERNFRPRAIAISGLGLYRYLDGPWEKLGKYVFRGV